MSGKNHTDSGLDNTIFEKNIIALEKKYFPIFIFLAPPAMFCLRLKQKRRNPCAFPGGETLAHVRAALTGNHYFSLDHHAPHRAAIVPGIAVRADAAAGEVQAVSAAAATVGRTTPIAPAVTHIVQRSGVAAAAPGSR